MSEKNIIFEWFGQSAFKIKIEDRILLFDPIRKNKLLETTLEPAIENEVSAIFVSHEHWDHYDADTILALSSPETKIYCPFTVASHFSCRLTFEAKDIQSFQKLTQSLSPVKIDDAIEMDGISVRCLEATEGLSFLIKYRQKKILFMGDSIATERMIKETPDIVLFPIWAVKGEEANMDMFLQLAKDALCIPMHYHTSEKGLQNFYIQKDEIKRLLPETIKMKIINREEPIVL